MVNRLSSGAMLNAYPDSIGGTLHDIVMVLQRPELKSAFSSFYILPSIYNTDLDRGFSLIDYNLNRLLATDKDLKLLREQNIDLTLDFILNHASVLSKEFQDILKKGEKSAYCDFFINWNSFWEGHGEMTPEGYIQPNANLIKDMFFRKPGLPILMVRFPDGRDIPYWNTFYQKVEYSRVDAQDLLRICDLQYGEAVMLANQINAALAEGKSPFQMEFGNLNGYREAVCSYLESHRKYLGQMDLNIRSPLVWDYYQKTLGTLANYGATIVRLDAFAYAHKEVGARNFLNDPGTWELLDRVAAIANPLGLNLLPEIHASYVEKIYDKLASKGYMVYDFFLPGLIIDAMERRNGEHLKRWLDEIVAKKIQTVNMLGCHDGIPLLDLKGLLDEKSITELIDTVVSRGGYVKNLHGQKNVYYQVNATYYSALGEDDRKLVLARAIQMFMPGKPQVWYLDLFAGKNDFEAMRRAGKDGHKEINRTNLSPEDVTECLQRQVVLDQLKLLRMRNSFRIFSHEANISAESVGSRLTVWWHSEDSTARLTVDFADTSFLIIIQDGKGTDEKFRFEQK